MVAPAMRFAARSGSTAEATHMIEEPENTSSVTLSGVSLGAEDRRGFRFSSSRIRKVAKARCCRKPSNVAHASLDAGQGRREAPGRELPMPLTMNREVFITCAVTGSGGTQDRSPHVPRSPKQIADSAIDAAKAGAAIVHCHVRDPETGKPRRDVAPLPRGDRAHPRRRCRRGAEPDRRHGRRHGVRRRREARCR